VCVPRLRGLPGGFGPVYRFDPATAIVTILHSFNITDGNGIFPNGPVVQPEEIMWSKKDILVCVTLR